MISRLDGVLVEKNPPSLVIDVQGVGYELEAPMSTFYSLPACGQRVQLLTHLVVREDAHLLFGFGSAVERRLFRSLLKVNGVGAKVALSILSGMNPEEFVACVNRRDSATLTRIPGIGKKTAERLLVEMQDKVGITGSDVDLPGTGSETSTASVRGQAEEALLALGYKATEAKRLLDKTAVDGQSVEELIRAALRSVAR